MIVAELSDGPCAGEEVTRPAAYWTPEAYVVVIVRGLPRSMEGQEGIIVGWVWHESEPDDRSLTYGSPDVYAHVYQLHHERRENRVRYADYRFERTVLGA